VHTEVWSVNLTEYTTWKLKKKRWEDNIQMYLGEIHCDDVECIKQIKDKIQ
jgi:hypothetical protein